MLLSTWEEVLDGVSVAPLREEGGGEEGREGGREGGREWREGEKRKKVRGREEGREEKEARDKGFRRYNCTILCCLLFYSPMRGRRVV